MEKHSEMNRCTRSEPTIGQGRLCNGGYGKQAWPECGEIDFSRCEIERNMDKAYKLCIDAVNAKKQKDTLWDRWKKLGDAANEAFKALRDSEKYIKNIAHDKLHKILLGNEKQGISQDETITHLYNYGYNFAKKGINYTNAPVIKDFQKHVLEKIGNAHKATLSKIDHIDSEMGNFIEELRAASENSSPAPGYFKPTPVKSSGGSDSDPHQNCYLKKSSCEQSCGDSVCLESCNDEWYQCRYE